MSLMGPDAYLGHSIQAAIFSVGAASYLQQFPQGSSESIWPVIAVVYALLAASITWFDKHTYGKGANPIPFICCLISSSGLLYSAYLMHASGYFLLAALCATVGCVILILGIAVTLYYFFVYHER